jgi:hypothetical protein
MQNNQSYLITLCEKICAQGLQPSLALIRGQATRPLPIPEVIKFLQSWKQTPQKKDLTGPAIEQKVELKDKLDLQSRVEKLEKQVTLLQQQLDTLLFQAGVSHTQV